MTGFEKVMAQNWVEQLKNGRMRQGYADSRNLRNTYGGDSAGPIVDNAFTWAESAEGDVVWYTRYQKLYDKDLVR